VSKSYSGGSNLDIFETAGSDLPMGEVSSLVGSLWSGLTANDVLSTAAKTGYPSTFLTSISPFTKFVTLPGVAGSASGEFIPVNANFVASVRDGAFKNRLKTQTGSDLRLPEEVWLSPGSAALAAVWSYAYELPISLGLAYGKLGNAKAAKTYGGTKTNSYRADGTVAIDRAGAQPDSLIFDLDLASCTDMYGTRPVGATDSSLQSEPSPRIVEERPGEFHRA
jgi:hypothetical protein